MSSSGQKSTVAQTCNLLSQYFKENGRFANNKGVETLNLLPNLENSAEISRLQNVKAKDFFADMPSFACDNSINEARTGHGSSHMTIIYAGKVFVFNDTSAEKAKEIMALATGAASSNAVVNPYLNKASASDNNSQTVPIARRASLHRFFEKRKDRVMARAPYQVDCLSSSVAPAAPPPKPKGQSKCSWLQLEGQSSPKQLDLNL